jgi:prepilin-type N-terminal cleavage/methylation domain-containing protein
MNAIAKNITQADSSSGFTLLEMLISIWLLSIAGLLTFYGVGNIIRLRSAQSAIAHEIKAERMIQGLRQEIRAIRKLSEMGGQRLVGDEGSISFPLVLSGRGEKIGVYRMRYWLEDSKIKSSSQPIFPANAEPDFLEVIEGVSSFKLSYTGNDQAEAASWSSDNELPHSVRIELQLVGTANSLKLEVDIPSAAY